MAVYTSVPSHKKKLSLPFSPITQRTVQSTFQSYILKSILHSYYIKNTKVYNSVLPHYKHYFTVQPYHTKNMKIYTSVLLHQDQCSLHFSPITPQILTSILQSYNTMNTKVYVSIPPHQKHYKTTDVA